MTLYAGPTAADLNHIPAALKELCQWVLWRGADKIDEQTGEIKLNKIPIDPHTLRNADTTDPLTWGTYQHCVEAMPVALEGWQHEHPATYRGGGLGYVFASDDPYCGIDLDKCCHPETDEIDAWAKERLEQLASYTEITPSGTGLHILVEGSLPPHGRKKDHVEMYDQMRFFTMTGWHLPGTPPTIEPRQAVLTAFHTAVFGRKKRSQTSETTPPISPAAPDTIVIEKARAAKNAPKFIALWGGDTSAHDHDDSSADLALCCMLAFWTQDPAQIDRLFRQSELLRDKWDEQRGAQTYGERTIAEALARQTEHYRYRRQSARQRSPSDNGETPLDESIYGPASRPARDPDALPYSDYTNALAFVHDHGANLRYCFPWGKWLAWTGTHWQIDDTGRVMRWAKETVKRLARHAEDLDDLSAIGALLRHVKASLSTAKLKALVENAQSELPLPVLPEALDSDHWLLNATNGTIDLRTGALQPHRREDLLTRCIPVAYDKDAACPTWDSFLQRIMDGNANLISFLQRAIGYALTGVIREHVLLILWGSGRNGKSTFLGTLLALLGAYAMKAPSELLMVSYNDRHPTERADLFHKRFVATIETEQGRRMAEVFVKEATGGDPITARRMREDFWTFDPTHKLFLATNHKPVIKGTDTAIWERIRLIPFTVTIPIKERDPKLPDKLRAELPGILAWAVRGCQAWQQDGLGAPDEVHQATAGYRAEMDIVGAFIEECCLTGPNFRVKASDLYDAYKHWCDQSGEAVDSQRTWGRDLTERGFERYPNNGTWYRGIALRHTSREETRNGLRKERNHTEPISGIGHMQLPRVGVNPEIGSVPSVPSVDIYKDDPEEFDEGVV